MASNTKTAADAVSEIVYAAFSTHFRTVYNASMPNDADPHALALEHWNNNLPGVALLWNGIAKAIIQNTANAQAQGIIPPLFALTDRPAQALPGLGGAPMANPNAPSADLARKLVDTMRQRQDDARRASPLPDASRHPLDTPPGLATERATGDE